MVFEVEALKKPISTPMTMKSSLVPVTTTYRALQAMELSLYVSVMLVVQEDILAGMVPIPDLLKLGL